MVNPGAFSGSRKTFLLSQKEYYAQAVNDGFVAEAVSLIQRKYFNRYPIDIPHDQEPSAEHLAAVDDDVAMAEPEEPDPESMSVEDYGKALALSEARQKLVLFRKAQIKHWFAYQYMKDLDIDTTHTGIFNPYCALFFQLTGKKVSCPRQRSAANTWRKTVRDTIEVEVKHRAAEQAENLREGVKADSLITLRDRVAREMFKELNEEDQRYWLGVAIEDHKVAMKEWKAEMEGKPGTDPKSRQIAIQGLVKFLQPILDHICEATGWKASFIAGGPEPAQGGLLNVLSIHSGKTTGDVKLSFGSAERERFRRVIVPLYGGFLQKCYTPEECRSRALQSEAGFLPLSQLDLEYEGVATDMISPTSAIGAAILENPSDSGVADTVPAKVPSTQPNGEQASPVATSTAEETKRDSGPVPASTAQPTKKARVPATTAETTKTKKVCVPASTAQPTKNPPIPTTTAETTETAPTEDVPRRETEDVARIACAGTESGTGGVGPSAVGERMAGEGRMGQDTVVVGDGAEDGEEEDEEDKPSNPFPWDVPGESPLPSPCPSPEPEADAGPVEPPSDTIASSADAAMEIEEDVAEATLPVLSRRSQRTHKVTKAAALRDEAPKGSKKRGAGTSADQEDTTHGIEPTVSLPTLSGRPAKRACLSPPKAGDGGGVSTSVFEVPADSPDWFKKAFAMLSSKDLGGGWTVLIGAWGRFESLSGYSGGLKIGTKNRPEAVKDWIQRARSPSWRPNIQSVSAYGGEFTKWWQGLQPEWRILRGGKLLRVAGGNWEDLRRPGVNGLLSVAAGLFFWGCVVQTPSDKAQWHEMVVDFEFVLSQLLAAF